QVAEYDGEIVGKPGGFEEAARQLRRISGKTARLYTGLALLNAKTGHVQSEVALFEVVFRTLDERRITRYLEKEQPYDCAGSAKSEGLGIALFERFIGDDPTTLIGLPLIRLVRMLEAEGCEIP
ncbi:MAG: Maf family protein, partial [Gammaproteobacteria bacterium]|nr:Maf family protein [Gammaproteobacteria bacterium]